MSDESFAFEKADEGIVNVFVDPDVFVGSTDGEAFLEQGFLYCRIGVQDAEVGDADGFFADERLGSFPFGGDPCVSCGDIVGIDDEPLVIQTVDLVDEGFFVEVFIDVIVEYLFVEKGRVFFRGQFFCQFQKNGHSFFRVDGEFCDNVHCLAFVYTGKIMLLPE